ncbi:hypothetical protein C8Q77DRAFT_855671 [Trametes polyzona]|nr:hypothetical protein C8Q77DRAFT_855671 [Trametes polyzona]
MVAAAVLGVLAVVGAVERALDDSFDGWSSGVGRCRQPQSVRAGDGTICPSCSQPGARERTASVSFPVDDHQSIAAAARAVLCLARGDSSLAPFSECTGSWGLEATGRRRGSPCEPIATFLSARALRWRRRRGGCALLLQVLQCSVRRLFVRRRYVLQLTEPGVASCTTSSCMFQRACSRKGNVLRDLVRSRLSSTISVLTPLNAFLITTTLALRPAQVEANLFSALPSSLHIGLFASC